MEPQLKSTRLIDGEVKGIMDNCTREIISDIFAAARMISKSGRGAATPSGGQVYMCPQVIGKIKKTLPWL